MNCYRANFHCCVSSLLLRLSAGFLMSFLLSGCVESPVQNREINGVPSQPPTPAVSLRFADRTADSKISFMYRSGSVSNYAPILQDFGGGCGLLDMDRDGRLDAFFPGGGYSSPTGWKPHPHGFFQNIGDAVFRDVAESSGLKQGQHYSLGAAAGDYDGDGFPDLIVTGYGGLQLFHNQGDGSFVELANAVGMKDQLWSTSGAWGDVNGDGHLDLYVCHYVDWSPKNDPVCTGPAPDKPEACPPARFNGLPDTLYLSLGNGDFEDVSKAAGLREDGKGLGVVVVDLDADGDVDIYVGNDTVANFLYRNDGCDPSGIPLFSEIGLRSGSALSDSGTPDGSMGIALLDFNQDGRPDLWVSNFEFETPGIYRNEGGLNFTHVTRIAGLATHSSTSVSFGTAAADFDGDGDDDVLVTNGHISRYPQNGKLKQPCQLFENLGNLRFREVAAQVGDCLNRPIRGRGLMCGDLDGDGDLDVVLAPLDQPVQILENTQSSRPSWLNLSLCGIASPRDGRGSAIILKSGGNVIQKWSYSGESYLSSCSPLPNFPDDVHAPTSEIEVNWPSKRKQLLRRIGKDEWTTDSGSCHQLAGMLVVVEPATE